MITKINTKRPLLRFFIYTYVIFLAFFGLTGASMALNLPQIIPDALQVICAWSPTFAFLILFKKIVPNQKLGYFLKQQITPRIAPGQLFTAIGIQIMVLIAVVVLVSIKNRAELSSVIIASPSVLVLGFLNILIRGPLGEELGWRGYALNHLQKRYSPLESSLIIGIVWGFWHTPLWFVTSGFTGVQLIKYAALFLVGIISISIIITFFYNKSKNLLIAVVIHQLLNYIGSVVNADGLQTMIYQSLLYLLTAIILIIIHRKSFVFRSPTQDGLHGNIYLADLR